MIWTAHAIDQLAARYPNLRPGEVEARSEAIGRNAACGFGCFVNDQSDILFDRQTNLFLVVKSEFIGDVVVTVIHPAPQEIVGRSKRSRLARRRARRRVRWGQR